MSPTSSAVCRWVVAEEEEEGAEEGEARSPGKTGPDGRQPAPTKLELAVGEGMFDRGTSPSQTASSTVEPNEAPAVARAAAPVEEEAPPSVPALAAVGEGAEAESTSYGSETPGAMSVAAEVEEEEEEEVVVVVVRGRTAA